MPYQLPDGIRVSYVGDGRDGRTLGDRGELLTTAGHTAHVKWDTGGITPHDVEDIAPVSARIQAVAAERDDFADSLEVGPIQATGLRAAYEVEGDAGVLNALASGGHLADFQIIAEEVAAFTEQRIRQSGSLRMIGDQLDAEEVDGVVRVAALALLRDAFGAVDE